MGNGVICITVNEIPLGLHVLDCQQKRKREISKTLITRSIISRQTNTFSLSSLETSTRPSFNWLIFDFKTTI